MSDSMSDVMINIMSDIMSGIMGLWPIFQVGRVFPSYLTSHV